MSTAGRRTNRANTRPGRTRASDHASGSYRPKYSQSGVSSGARVVTPIRPTTGVQRHGGLQREEDGGWALHPLDQPLSCEGAGRQASEIQRQQMSERERRGLEHHTEQTEPHDLEREREQARQRVRGHPQHKVGSTPLRLVHAWSRGSGSDRGGRPAGSASASVRVACTSTAAPTATHRLSSAPRRMVCSNPRCRMNHHAVTMAPTAPPRVFTAYRVPTNFAAPCTCGVIARASNGSDIPMKKVGHNRLPNNTTGQRDGRTRHVAESVCGARRSTGAG